uniref:Uncharacterized protein n=1 Tax=Physcomitrium patens TaxID=3218 RepID=A0A7I4F785_PHYPA
MHSDPVHGRSVSSSSSGSQASFQRLIWKSDPTMASSRNLLKQVQSSDDSEESSAPAGEKDAHVVVDQRKPPEPSGGFSHSKAKHETELMEFAATQAHQTNSALERVRKSVVIEIKGKAPPGKDGVFALNRDTKCEDFKHEMVNINANAGTDRALDRDELERTRDRALMWETQGSLMHERKDYGSFCQPNLMLPSTLNKMRLIDTKNFLPPYQAWNTSHRGKRVQDRGVMMGVNERMQERRDRCNALQSLDYDARRFKRGATLPASLHQDILRENPVWEMDSKQGGVLKLCHKSFNEDGCESLLRVIKNNEKLVELDLSGCNIYNGDHLAEIVRSSTSLNRLSLEWNSLGLARTGIAAFTSALASNRSLKEVDLRSNRIGPSTAAALAHALQSNLTLTCLDLRWNEIGPSGAAAIMAMLQRNHSLVDVRLVGNGIPPSIQAQIDDLLEKNRTCKLLQGPAPVGPASENRMYPETETGLNSRAIPKEMSDINLERIASLQKELDGLRHEMEACRTELYETQLQKVATDTQLETVRVELKEENLLRKFIEKEAEDLNSQISLSKQQVHDIEEKLTRNEQMVAMKSSALNSEIMEAREKGHQAQIAEAEARRENKHLKDQIARIQAESKARMEATQERAKTDIDYKISIIKRLEADMAQREVKHNEEMESVSAKLSAQIKKLEIARENAIRESERLNAAVMQLETQLAAKEKYFQNEKVCYCNVIYHLLQRVSEVGLMFFVSVLFCKIRC